MCGRIAIAKVRAGSAHTTDDRAVEQPTHPLSVQGAPMKILDRHIAAAVAAGTLVALLIVVGLDIFFNVIT